jgi:hypothetical protein
MVGYELCASGGILDAAGIGNYENYLDEGQRGLLELDLRLPVSQGVAQELESKLRQAGVEDVRVTTASPLMRVYFRKGFPWLAVIVAAIAAIAILAVMIVGWRLFREVIPESLQPIVGTAVILILIGLAVVLFMRRR